MIAVDWAHQSFHKDAAILLKYEKAVKNTIDVGASIAEFIKFLVKQKAIKSLGVVHLVGFSLGAHVAGVTGNLLGGKVGRITGKAIRVFLLGIMLFTHVYTTTHIQSAYKHNPTQIYNSKH